MSGPYRQNVTVKNEQGMHMIPCSRVAQLVRETSCQVQIIRDDQVADARNILDLLMLKAEVGTSLLIESEGEGAESILAQIVKLFDDDFEIISEN
ncbi:MAG: HPr family phosphocarrier protein [Planctomycetaceae bacterium]|nr:HPr family phosphocarrier protein [Planctomycetaceae bacterium]MDC0307912.1 HPr family phosphocarrier protein [Planctomycetaceae bacterium]MDG2390201.1 HPr family phosphocarrier protein [Planctomycetaceae bacterium]